VKLLSQKVKSPIVCATVQDTSKGEFCLRPPAVPKRVKPQNITLVLNASFVSCSLFWLLSSADVSRSA